MEARKAAKAARLVDRRKEKEENQDLIWDKIK
jgi:hypothetical protein